MKSECPPGLKMIIKEVMKINLTQISTLDSRETSLSFVRTGMLKLGVRASRIRSSILQYVAGPVSCFFFFFFFFFFYVKLHECGLVEVHNFDVTPIIVRYKKKNNKITALKVLLL